VICLASGLVFFSGRPPQLGPERDKLARNFAVAQLITRHQQEFDTLLAHHREEQLRSALAELPPGHRH